MCFSSSLFVVVVFLFFVLFCFVFFFSFLFFVVLRPSRLVLVLSPAADMIFARHPSLGLYLDFSWRGLELLGGFLS